MTFTCISSGNSIHRNIFSYERRKDDKQDSYVQHKTFHMKINNFSYENQQLKKLLAKNGCTMYTHYPSMKKEKGDK